MLSRTARLQQEMALVVVVWDKCLDTYTSVHFLLGELPDVLDGLGGSELELDALESLVHVKSVVAAGWLHF